MRIFWYIKSYKKNCFWYGTFQKNSPHGFLPGSTLVNPLGNRRHIFLMKAGKILSILQQKILRLDGQVKSWGQITSKTYAPLYLYNQLTWNLISLYNFAFQNLLQLKKAIWRNIILWLVQNFGLGNHFIDIFFFQIFSFE